MWDWVGVAVLVDEDGGEFLERVVFCVSIVVGDRVPVTVIFVRDCSFECSEVLERPRSFGLCGR